MFTTNTHQIGYEIFYIQKLTENILIFDKLNLVIEPGAKVALVGSSGSGKTSLVALLERFYNEILNLTL